MRGGHNGTGMLNVRWSLCCRDFNGGNKEIYRSSNGDRWTVIRDTSSRRQFVRHEPDLSPGGRVTDTDVDEFLSVAGSGPAYVALGLLLDRPVERAPPA
jgi:hypothetical protein